MIRSIEEFYQSKYDFYSTLDDIHNHILNYPTHIPTFGKNDRELYLIRDFYDEYDNNSKFEELYKSLIQEKVKPIFDNEKHVASDDDSYVTINLDTPPDSTRKKV